MKLLLINNDGGGFADYIEVPAGTTVAQLFEQKMGDVAARDYLIRVNRQENDSGGLPVEFISAWYLKNPRHYMKCRSKHGGIVTG